MRKIVFLDRDGVLNFERGDYTFKKQQYVFNDEIVPHLLRWKKNGFEFIVITNQGGIGKKRYDLQDFQAVMDLIKADLAAFELQLLDVYYCPHHPLSSNCLCRKPKGLLIEKAIAQYNIDRSASFLIGDSPRDEQAASHAGIKSHLIPPNQMESLSKII